MDELKTLMANFLVLKKLLKHFKNIKRNKKIGEKLLSSEKILSILTELEDEVRRISDETENRGRPDRLLRRRKPPEALEKRKEGTDADNRKRRLRN